MKDQRSATEEIFGEITAGHRRSSKRADSERRDSNLSGITALNYQEIRARPLLKDQSVRTANGCADERRRRLPSARSAGLSAKCFLNPSCYSYAGNSS